MASRSDHEKPEKPAVCGGFVEALCRTRTGDLSVESSDDISTGGPDYSDSPDDERDTTVCGSGRDAVEWRDRRDNRAPGCETTLLAGGYALDNRVRQVDGALRLRLRARDRESPDELRLVMTRTRSRRPRLTSVATVSRGGTVTLRLTPAGRRHLRRFRTVLLVSLSDIYTGNLEADEAIPLRVTR